MSTIYLVWPADEDESDARKIEAMDAENAAEEWAREKDWDSADFAIANGSDATVLVRPIDGGEIEAWLVRGWSAPVYSAHRTPGTRA